MPRWRTGYRYSLIGVLAVAMGIQNAAACKLAVPDLTTTVLTLTITGIAADSVLAGGSGSKSGRRLLSAVAMLSGALVGASFVVHSVIYVPLAIALPADGGNCRHDPGVHDCRCALGRSRGMISPVETQLAHRRHIDRTQSKPQRSGRGAGATGNGAKRSPEGACAPARSLTAPVGYRARG